GAVISYPFWQREYAGSESVIGRKISLNGHPMDIIGVTQPGFYGVVVGDRFDVAVPLCAQAAVDGEDNSALDRPYVWWLTVMGRLNPGWNDAKALAELNSFASSLFHDTLPPTFSGDRVKYYLNLKFKLLPAGNGVSDLREQYTSPLWLLLGISGLVLLIACANLANLMLARASAREREITIRRALGASRWRMIRELLAESALIAVLGAILGFILAQWLTRAMVAFISTEGNALFFDLRPDWPILAFTAGIAMLTCVLFGLLPALRATRVSPQ